MLSNLVLTYTQNNYVYLTLQVCLSLITIKVHKAGSYGEVGRAAGEEQTCLHGGTKI